MLARVYKHVSPTGEVTFFLPAFPGTPYIATKVDANFYHLILMPWDAAFDFQLTLVFRQARANRLPTFLVWERGSALAFHSEGLVEPARVSPQDGLIVVQDKLVPAIQIPKTKDVVIRSRALEEYARAQHKGGCFTGDFFHGGRPATASELVELAGFSEAGVPKGLEICPECLEWRGFCINPNPLRPNLLVPVYCSCENIHRCARCGDPLCDRRLCGNYWNPVDEGIWYVPGFSAFAHECGDRVAARAEGGAGIEDDA